MKRILMAAIVVAVVVVAAGAMLYASQGQSSPPAANDFTATEKQLNDLEDFTALDNFDNDFGIGEIAGNW